MMVKKCEILQSPKILYRSLLFIATMILFINHKAIVLVFWSQGVNIP